MADPANNKGPKIAVPALCKGLLSVPNPAKSYQDTDESALHKYIADRRSAKALLK